ncbi:unannotated protein [freshwater metagenome]|uniref:Unannotated protein n=1 Tax=freshwater metagenome TaxID=449393 RepID=A0A6J7CX26_9ZZZZ|nr:hypothetical protein [Actinomycetota bacterium]
MKADSENRRSSPANPLFRIDPQGNLGNQMLQYMAALTIASHVPGLMVCGHDLPVWGLSTPVPPDYPPDAIQVGGRYLPAHQIARYMRRGALRALTVGVVSLRLEHLVPLDIGREVFRPPIGLAVDGYGPDCVVINIRAGEVLGDVHPDYGPIPLSFMSQVIESSQLHPVFIGQLGDDPYSLAIRRRYPNATFRPSQGALIDFEIIRRSSEIAIAVSTFSWLAAWLSSAHRIHMPVSGFYNPRQRPGIDLLAVDDDRYRFYDCEVAEWRATTADFDSLLAHREHAILTAAQIQARREQAKRRTAWSDLCRQAEFAWQCRQRWAHDRIR